MHEQQAEPGTSTGARPVASARSWLRSRLMPCGDESQLLAAYAMILTAIVILIFNPPPPPAWHFYVALTALIALLIVNIIGDAKQPPVNVPLASVFLAINTLLLFTAIWFGLSDNTFLPFLLFMLVSQACLLLPLSAALLMSVALLAAWIGVLWLRGFDSEGITNNLVMVGLGMIFSIIFSLATLRASRQQARAEGLLDELRLVNAELTAAREREKELAAAEERVRVAREIHDGLGHHLTVLNVQLQAATKLVERDPARARETLAICREEAQAALAEVRQSVATLRRTPLDGRSLDEALALLVGDFRRRAGLAASYELHGTPIVLSPAATTTLYRAAQEGLTNAHKHAGAEQVAVALSFDPAVVRLHVCDDGTGTEHEAELSGGFGLAGLRERADQLGGRLEAGLGDAGGFVLELSLPTERNRDDSHRAG